LTVRRLLTLIVVALALVAAGCGDDDEGGDAAEEAALSADEAIAEIGLVRQGLDEGLAAYADGEAEQAEALVGDAYLEHFELVEPPLEEADEELNESLEVLIRETLRDAIVTGENLTDVEKLVQQANAGLDQAEAALSGGQGTAGGAGS